MDHIDLTAQKIERDLAELIGESKSEVDWQESKMVVHDVEDNAKKEPKIKNTFIPLSKEEIDKLSRRKQLEYRIELSKFKTQQLKSQYQNYKQQESKTNRSRETNRLIIMGRFLDTQLKHTDRKDQYEMIEGHLNQYLTNDSDRALFELPPLAKLEEDDTKN